MEMAGLNVLQMMTLDIPRVVLIGHYFKIEILGQKRTENWNLNIDPMEWMNPLVGPFLPQLRFRHN